MRPTNSPHVGKLVAFDIVPELPPGVLATNVAPMEIHGQIVGAYEYLGGIMYEIYDIHTGTVYRISKLAVKGQVIPTHKVVPLDG